MKSLLAYNRPSPGILGSCFLAHDTIRGVVW